MGISLPEHRTEKTHGVSGKANNTQDPASSKCQDGVKHARILSGKMPVPGKGKRAGGNWESGPGVKEKEGRLGGRNWGVVTVEMVFKIRD